VAPVLLALVYLAALALGDPRVGLIADSGGKLATAEVMAEGGTISPDVGYWAEDLDPDGLFHPLANTRHTADGWVQATSLPYAVATGGLWSLGGPIAVALLSVAGGVAAALAARHLARRLGATTDLAFWLVGLGSPLAVYAVDAWEHAPATALALWGIVLALDPRRPARAAAAGALLGSAMLLRAEMGAYVLAFGVAVLLVPEVRRRWARLPLLAAGALAGLSLLLGNALVERAIVGAGVRDARAATGVAATTSFLGQRLTDAVVTGFGLFPDQAASGLLVAAVLAGALVALALTLTGRLVLSDVAVKGLAAVVALLYLFRLLDGWANVPGALAAAPAVVLVAGLARTSEVRVLLGTALGAIPVVWGLQWTGDHIVQWGGRYLLISTVLLLVLAAVAMEGAIGRHRIARGLVAITFAVGLVGLAWHVHRADVIGAEGDALAELPDDTVVVTTLQHLGRELGSWYGDRRWLSADEGSLDRALDVAARAEPPTITVVRPVDPLAGGVDSGGGDDSNGTVPSVDGYHPVESREIPALGRPLDVQVLARD
jgi:hypothetical protein